MGQVSENFSDLVIESIINSIPHFLLRGKTSIIVNNSNFVRLRHLINQNHHQWLQHLIAHHHLPQLLHIRALVVQIQHLLILLGHLLVLFQLCLVIASVEEPEICTGLQNVLVLNSGEIGH